MRYHQVRIVLLRGHAFNLGAALTTTVLATGLLPHLTFELSVLAGVMWAMGALESAATDLHLVRVQELREPQTEYDDGP